MVLQGPDYRLLLYGGNTQPKPEPLETILSKSVRCGLFGAGNRLPEVQIRDFGLCGFRALLKGSRDVVSRVIFRVIKCPK